IGDDVVLAFEPELSGIARARLAIARDVLVIGDGLGADESLLEIGVDHSGSLRRARAARDRPGAGFLWSRGEERDEPQERVTCADETIESRLLEAEMGEEFVALVRRQLRDFLFDARRDRNTSRTLD